MTLARWLVIGLVLGALGVAHADTPAKAAATAAYREGQRHYAAGEYPAAAAKFLDAYDADPDPVYLFNAAQAFRFAEDCVQAAAHYRRFLAAVASAPNLDRVRANLEEMEACVKRLAQPQPQPPQQPPLAAPPAPAIAPPPRTEAPPARTAVTVLGPQEAVKRRIGIALGVAGLAAIGVGVWFQHDVGYFENRVASCIPARPCTAHEVDGWNDRGHRASFAAITSYTVAGVAIVGGVTLYWLGIRTPAPEWIDIAPAPGGALIGARGAF